MKSIAFAFSIFTALNWCSATPVPPTNPVNVSGEIVSFVWIDKTHFEGDGDRIRLRSATSPAKYIVILRTASIDAKSRKSLTSMVRISDLSGLRHIITALELKEEEMLVQFSSPKFPMLKVGSKLALDGYSLAGDEWGIGATFDALKIDGRIQRIQGAEQGGTGQPATRPESKSEGSDKPQPGGEGSSR